MDKEEKDLIEPLVFDSEEARSKFISSYTPLEADKPTGLIKPMDFDVRTKDIEEKTYIILYKIDDDTLEEDFRNIFKVCIGRTEVYNDIKSKLISGVNVDIHRSRIITETKQTETQSGDRKYYLIPYEECVSIYAFFMSVQDYYSFDDFDIEDYNNSEVPENENENDLTNNPRYLTPEELTYRSMMETAMRMDDLMANLRQASMNPDGSNNI